MTNLNDTEAGGLLTEADFKPWTEPRRAMDYRPQRYEDAQVFIRNRGDSFLSTCTAKACGGDVTRCPCPNECRVAEDSQFGAVEGFIKGRRYVAGAWVLVVALVAAVWAGYKFIKEVL